MQIRYVYKKSDKTFQTKEWRTDKILTYPLWEIGYYDPSGNYVISEYINNTETAVDRVSRLNGGRKPKERDSYESAYAGWGEP